MELKSIKFKIICNDNDYHLYLNHSSKINQMTWQVNFTYNYKQSGECCLELCHEKRNTQLRSWFGPLAQHLFNQPQLKLFSDQTKEQYNFSIDKQMAQFLLIKASFFHQRCLHMYQVKDDIKRQELIYSHELCELLLFIRMSNQHPSHQTLELFVEYQIPWCEDLRSKIESLLSAKLIQKISLNSTYKHNGLVFYDKNPYPHDHLLNLETLKLNDVTHTAMKHDQQQLLICQTP